MSLESFNAVPTRAIETLHEGSQPWFKRADLGRYLGIADIRHNLKNIATKSRLEIAKGGGGPTPSLKQVQNWHDAFVTLDVALEITVRSKKPRAVDLVKWLVKKGIEKVQEEHQLAIEEQQGEIALLNNDLEELEYNNTGLEIERDVLEEQVAELERRGVPHLQNPRKDNGMAIIHKNNDDPFPYVAICGQQGYVAQKIQNKLADYPNGQLVVLAETPNAIVHYNWLRERGCVVANPDRVRHFRLGDHYTHHRLMELQEA